MILSSLLKSEIGDWRGFVDSAPRMKLPVGIFQSFRAHVRVDLRCGYVRVAEKFLDHPEIGPAFQQMGRE